MVETDAVGKFYYNLFGNFQSQHRATWFSKVTSKKFLCSQVVPIMRFEDKLKINRTRNLGYIQRKQVFLVDSAPDSPKLFEQAKNNLQIPLAKPNLEIEFTNSKTFSLLITMRRSLKNEKDKNSISVPFWKEPILQFCQREVPTTC